MSAKSKVRRQVTEEWQMVYASDCSPVQNASDPTPVGIV